MRRRRSCRPWAKETRFSRDAHCLTSRSAVFGSVSLHDPRSRAVYARFFGTMGEEDIFLVFL